MNYEGAPDLKVRSDLACNSLWMACEVARREGHDDALRAALETIETEDGAAAFLDDYTIYRAKVECSKGRGGELSVSPEVTETVVHFAMLDILHKAIEVADGDEEKLSRLKELWALDDSLSQDNLL